MTDVADSGDHVGVLAELTDLGFPDGEHAPEVFAQIPIRYDSEMVGPPLGEA